MIYLLDNQQSYSDHCLDFVESDWPVAEEVCALLLAHRPESAVLGWGEVAWRERGQTTAILDIVILQQYFEEGGPPDPCEVRTEFPAYEVPSVEEQQRQREWCERNPGHVIAAWWARQVPRKGAATKRIEYLRRGLLAASPLGLLWQLCGVAPESEARYAAALRRAMADLGYREERGGHCVPGPPHPANVLAQAALEAEKRSR